MAKKKKRKQPKTISQMTGTRGAMPPPTVVDVIKRKKNDRQKVKQKLKRGYYDV